MKQIKQLTNQGDSVEEFRKNLIEAIELFFEMASPQEILKLI